MSILSLIGFVSNTSWLVLFLNMYTNQEIYDEIISLFVYDLFCLCVVLLQRRVEEVSKLCENRSKEQEKSFRLNFQ